MSHVPEIVLPRATAQSTIPPLVYYLFLSATVGVYLLLASYRLAGIPLGYDELLFCNAALGCIDPDLFAFVKIGSLPVLLMDYIGALKAWLYYPIFKLFGVSVWSIRFPMVVLTAGGLLWLGNFIRQEWGWKLALLAVTLLALDASFVHYTRFDTGPNAVELFLKIMTVAYWLRFVRSGRVRYVVLISVALLLGLFNKLNFIWYINAFYAGLVVAYGRWAFDGYFTVARRPLIRLFWLLSGTYLLAVAYLLFAAIAFDVLGQKIGNEKGLEASFSRVISLFNDVMVGSELRVYNYWFGFIGWPKWLSGLQPLVGTIILVTSAIAALLVLIRARVIGPVPAAHRLFVFTVVVLFALLAQLMVTERARYGWHIFSVYPFATMASIYAIQLLWGWLPGPVALRRAGTLLTLTALLGVVISAQYFMMYGLRRQAFRHRSETNALIDYARPINQKFIIVGGACTTQLLTMTQQADKYYELAYLFDVTHKFLTIRARDHDEFARKYLATPGEYLFIDSADPMPRGSVVRFRDFYCRPFLDVVAEHGAKVEVVKELLGPRDGYRIYRVVK